MAKTSVAPAPLGASWGDTTAFEAIVQAEQSARLQARPEGPRGAWNAKLSAPQGRSYKQATSVASPSPAKAQAWQADTATEAQMRFLRVLAGEKEVSSTQEAFLSLVLAGTRTLTKGEASRVIEGLKTAPRRSVATQVAQEEAKASSPAYVPQQGDCHLLEGKILKVAIGRESGRPYCKTLNEGPPVSWEMSPRGSVSLLSQATLLSLEEAREFGRRTGTCCLCGRGLTDASSIQEGIGPVCAGRQGARLAGEA